jgi:hypothetical protein
MAFDDPTRARLQRFVVAAPRAPRPHSHRAIIDRPFSVIANLTTPTDRPATPTIPGVAFVRIPTIAGSRRSTQGPGGRP